jgi:hypothetical protein
MREGVTTKTATPHSNPLLSRGEGIRGENINFINLRIMLAHKRRGKITSKDF